MEENSLISTPTVGQTVNIDDCEIVFMDIQQIQKEDLTHVTEVSLSTGVDSTTAEQILPLRAENENSDDPDPTVNNNPDDPDFIPDDADADTDPDPDFVADDADAEDHLPAPKKKRSKRQHVKEDNWHNNIQKRKRELGLKYSGKKRQEGKWVYRNDKPSRVIKPRCKCVFNKKQTNCFLFTEIQRLDIFNDFWERTWPEKQLLIKLLIDIKPTKRHRDRKQEEVSRRKSTACYHLWLNNEKVRVCKQMFLNTLSIGEWSALNWAKDDAKHDATLDATEDNNALKENVVEQTSAGKRSFFAERRQSLLDFFNSLPKMESHYCRSSSAKIYLESNWLSKADLYNFYTEEWCKNRNMEPLALTTFRLEFENQNLSVFLPKKDRCETCGVFEAKNLSENVYNLHRQKVDEARKEKEADKGNVDECVMVLTMDLQSVLLSPKSNISTMYYKTKLVIHNFTIFDIQSKKGYCFLWNETEGNVTAQEFATILSKFLSAQIENTSVRRIILYSDGCTAQNRNSTLANAMLNISISHSITIEQKFLCKGHTQMEADSMHSCIERIYRKTDINVPADYIDICKKARKSNPYEVQYLDHTYFLSFTSVGFFKSIRPGKKKGDACVTDIVALKYSDSAISYKLKFSDSWNLLPSRPEIPIKCVPVTTLPQLYHERIKINKRKYNDLQDLKTSLPRDFHDFYDNIPYHNE